ncbi:MAG: hypothetical protein FWH26_02620 [Oscillospiraceae bacterium]|nr:hypothetical protein [Oscillospiraceae bacterium]
MTEPGAADTTIRGRKKMKKWKKVLLIVVGGPIALFIVLAVWGMIVDSNRTPEEKAAIAESRAIAQSERESRAAEQSRIAAEEAARTTTITATTKTAQTTKTASATTISPDAFFDGWDKLVKERPEILGDQEAWNKYMADHADEYEAFAKHYDEQNAARTTISLPPETEKSYEFVTYNDLARYPDKWRSKNVTIEGKVTQVVEDGLLRISVTEGDFGIWRDNIVIFGGALNDRDGRILVDDVIIVWGRYDGLTTYASVLGSSTTAPKIFVERYEYAP